ncbi:hypothetical protein YC2023_043371 [Brassica napus]
MRRKNLVEHVERHLFRKHCSLPQLGEACVNLPLRNRHDGLSQKFQRNRLRRNKGRQYWCHDQSRQGGALGQRGLDRSRSGLRRRMMQAPKVFWWSSHTGDSVEGLVTAGEIRHGLEFDMKEVVRVYLDRLQRMHAPKFDKEEAVRVYLRRASQLFESEDDSGWKHVCFGFSAWNSIGNDLFEQWLSRDLCIGSLLSRELSGVFCWQQQRCRMMFKIMLMFIQVTVNEYLRITVGLLTIEVEAEVSMVIIKCMVVTEVIGLHGFEDMVVIGRASGLRFQGKATKESSGCIELDTCVMLGGNLFKAY